jgi:uncharacterized protein YqhQ
MSSEELKLPSYGGQALIEGVMMRGSRFLAAALRSPEGEIVIHTEELGKIYSSNIKNIPILRGLILLWDALGIGIRYLTISANLQTGEDEQIEGPLLYGTLAASIGIAVLLFFLVPAGLGQWSESLLNWGAWWGNLLEGFIRLLFIILYIWGIGRLEDIDRVFQFHGAEHKTINAFEANSELTPEKVTRFSLEHPRCGTSFLLTLVLFSIIFFAALGPLPVVWRLASRVLFLPLLAGFAYEYIRWTANHMDSAIVRFLVKPNMALQRLTTREPDLKTLEVSIAAFNAMYALENPSATSKDSEATTPSTEQPAFIGEGQHQNQ